MRTFASTPPRNDRTVFERDYCGRISTSHLRTPPPIKLGCRGNAIASRSLSDGLLDFCRLIFPTVTKKQVP